MRIKTIVILFTLKLNFCFSILGFSQNIEKKTNNSIPIQQQPKALMPAQSSIVNKSSVSLTDSNHSKKSIKESISNINNESNDELEKNVTESLLQGIITKNSEEFKNHEELIYDEEHISFFLNDSIKSNILRVNNRLNAMANSLDAVLIKFGSSHSDSANINKIKNSTLEELRRIIHEENKEKDSLNFFQELQKEKIKELRNASNVLEKLQQSLKPQFDSINKLIRNIKETSLLNLTINKVKYRVLIVPTSTSVIRVHNNASNRLQTLKDFWNIFKAKPFAVLNAGMFESNGSAKGLLVVNKKQLKKLDELKDKAKGNFYMLPNGVFYIDTLGKVFVLKTEDYKKNILPFQDKLVEFATQSGPMLMINGKSNPNFNKLSLNRNIRNGVGVVDNTDHKIAVFILSENECTFYEMTSLFRLLNCSNALYLDGAISKMYTDIRGKKLGNLADGALGPILSISKK